MLRTRWTDRERARLRELRPHMKLTQIAIELGRPRGSVAHEASRMKLFRPNGTHWSREEMARIAQMWPNYSATQIGNRLGRSRNAVIGVINRQREKMKLKNKTTARPRLPPRITPPKPAPPPPPRPRPMMPMQCPCQLVELDAINCKWPYGDPHLPGFYFCGAVIEQDGRPYCAAHARIASDQRVRPSPRRPASGYGSAPAV